MRKYILLFTIFLISFSFVGCNKNKNTYNSDIYMKNLNYTKEEFEQEYVDYLFFIQQSLQEISGGDNSVVTYHKIYKLNTNFTKDNLVSLNTIQQAEQYTQNMKVDEIKLLLMEYINIVKEINEDFVYAANNPNVTEDNIIEINKNTINKLELKLNSLTQKEYDTVSPISTYFAIGDLSQKVDYAISNNLEYAKLNTLNKLKLVANEKIAEQLLNTIYE